MWNITVAAYPNLQVTLTVIKKLPLSNLRSNNHPNFKSDFSDEVIVGMKWHLVWNDIWYEMALSMKWLWFEVIIAYNLLVGIPG